MKNTKVLEMILANRIDELKEMLRDEIYSDILKTKPGAKQRYAAMKRYFRYSNSVRDICTKPCLIEFNGRDYTSFCNSYSLALTTEPPGTIELFDDKSRYPDVTRLIHFDGDIATLDIKTALAEAKSKGYKLKQSEVTGKPGYLFHHNGAYFKVGLVDITYGIINNGEKVTAYHSGKNGSITITNDIGVCAIMPMRYVVKPEEDIVIIDVKGVNSNAY